ncbi:hypothetical protein SLS56_008920 [Neofusicoccum ribis]|uniref:NmrA-like domain-containing protein n=1 Tax=Neofusicoccum ribis TaxID=45134 RepID=A0ABR3SIT0_9PEZI
MVKIAVSGGSSGIGRAIVEVLQSHPQHTVFILSRKPQNQCPDIPGVSSIQVDYYDVDGLKDTLEKHQINTVISATSINGSADGQAQLNLIKASEKSSATKRFIPSEWALDSEVVDPALAGEPYIKFKTAAIKELRKTDLQWTRFAVGFLSDYYGPPHLKSYMTPYAFVLDVAGKAAGIPGTGNEPITLTYTFDIAAFVAAMMELPDWPETSRVIGDTTTWNECVKHAEEALGAKFDVSYDSVEKLQSFQITELPCHVPVYAHYPKVDLQKLFAIFGIWNVKGILEVQAEGSLNEKFPEIKTKSMKEILQSWRLN